MRKHKNRRLPKKYILFASLIALVMFAATVTVFYIVLGSYDGLGMRHAVPENSYSTEGFHREKGRIYYEDDTYTSVAGIDVSYYQKDIDWERVKAAGIDFAMIRLGYRGTHSGKLTMDSYFKDNLREAKAAGVDVGVYFFSQAQTTKEAIREARFVLRHIRGKGVTYPVAFDMEPVEGGDRITGLTVSEKTEIADAFCQVIRRNGYTPVIYGNPNWLLENLDLRYLTDYPVWLAHYTDSTDYPYSYVMWQYTQDGRVDGIRGDVDLNLYFVEKE